MMGNRSDLGREPVYTASEVAALLRLSEDTVYRRIKAGLLDAFKVGKEYRIKESVLDAYLDTLGFTSDTSAPATATA